MMFDTIVVGAGSAGCALVHQLLKKTGRRILLVEAGGTHRRLAVSMPMGFPLLHDDPRTDWMYRPEQPANTAVSPPRWKGGRLLGGSSSINGMVYVRGQPEDYDHWAALGNPGWGWAEVLAVYREMEDHQLGQDEMRGAGGPLTVSCTAEPNALSDAYIQAGLQLGLAVKTDLNRADQAGIGYYQRTIRHGRRVSAAAAFLDPLRGHPRLTVLTGTQVRRVVLENGRATGIECLYRGQIQHFSAQHEVVLCAGAIGSPKLLQLSGIGPAAHLAGLGIALVRDLPGVGANLQEHLNAGCVHTVRKGSLNHQVQGLPLARNLARYLLFRRGIMAMAAAQVGAFFKTRPDVGNADAQVLMAPLCMASRRNPDRPTVSANDHDKTVPAAIGGLTSFGCPLHPAPGGSVLIASPDAGMAPRIRYEHLHSEADRAVTVAIIRFIRRMAAQPALTDFGLEEVWPGPAVQSDDALISYALAHGQPGYHPVGTCKMGNDPMAVVSADLAVIGVAGLRVADASVMPRITSGNTNAPAMMIGFKLGGMVAAETASAPR